MLGAKASSGEVVRETSRVWLSWGCQLSLLPYWVTKEKQGALWAFVRLGSQQAKPPAFSITHNRGMETSSGSKGRNAGSTYEWKTGQRTCRVILEWSFPSPDTPHSALEMSCDWYLSTEVIPDQTQPYQSLFSVIVTCCPETHSSQPQVYARSQDLSQNEPSKAIAVIVREEKKPRVYLLSKSWWILIFTVALYLEFLTTHTHRKKKKEKKLSINRTRHGKIYLRCWFLHSLYF